MRDRANRLLLNLIAAGVAAGFSLAITAAILLASGHSPVSVASQMWDYGTQAGPEVSILNSATVSTCPRSPSRSGSG